jgi:hypothetical protein
MLASSALFWLGIAVASAKSESAFGRKQGVRKFLSNAADPTAGETASARPFSRRNIAPLIEFTPEMPAPCVNYNSIVQKLPARDSFSCVDLNTVRNALRRRQILNA